MPINFKKLTNWEYWPWYMFYLPNVPYAAYLALRAKNLVFFSATNPAIKYSGNGSESKYRTTQLIPENYRPRSIFISSNSKIDIVIDKISASAINFPLIIKPDIGFRGLLVKKINSKNELLLYLKKFNFINLLIQEYVDFKNECSIFYYRYPNELIGKISSITLKKYLCATGNGKSTLIELINADERSSKYIDLLTDLHLKDFQLILKKDEKKILNIIGNHCKGTQFINGNHLIDTELENTIDAIFKEIPNWFYGRLDIKFNSWESLKQKKEFKIIEINGIISEPTHIYDPTNITYFSALKEIRKHWKIAYKIATINHSIYQVNYSKIGDFLKSLRKLKENIDQIKKQPFSF